MVIGAVNHLPHCSGHEHTRCSRKLDQGRLQKSTPVVERPKHQLTTKAFCDLLDSLWTKCSLGV